MRQCYLWSITMRIYSILKLGKVQNLDNNPHFFQFPQLLSILSASSPLFTWFVSKFRLGGGVGRNHIKIFFFIFLRLFRYSSGLSVWSVQVSSCLGFVCLVFVLCRLRFYRFYLLFCFVFCRFRPV